MKKALIILILTTCFHAAHTQANAFNFSNIKSFSDIKNSLKSFNKVIIEQSQKLLESGCKNLCSAEAIKAEKYITGNTVATCSICAPICRQLQAKGQVSAQQAASFSQVCRLEGTPFTFSLDPQQLATLKKLFGQIGKLIQQNKIKVASTPKQINSVQVSIHEALGIKLTPSQTKKIVQKENKELEKLLKDELNDNAIKEIANTLLDADAFLEAEEKSKNDPWVNKTANKLINYLADIAEQEKKISPNVLQEAKKNLKKSFVPVKAPKNIIDQGNKAIGTIMEGIRKNFITFKIGKYSKQTNKPLFDEERSAKIMNITIALKDGKNISKEDRAWFLEWLATPASHIYPGIFIVATQTLKQQSNAKAILKSYAPALKAFHDSYIALRMHQKRTVNKKLEREIIYNQYYQTARRDLKNVVTAIKNDSVGITANNSAQQKQFDQIEKRIETNKPLSVSQKKGFLADIQKGSFKLKATTKKAKGNAAKGESMLDALKKAFDNLPQLEEDLTSEWEENDNGSWAA